MARRILMILGLFLIPFAASGQSGAVPMDAAYTITLPLDWTWDSADPYVGFYLTGDDYTVYLVDPAELYTLVRYQPNAPMAELFVRVYRALYSEGDQPTVADLLPLDITERDGLVWRWQADDLEGMFVLLKMSDNRYGVLDIFADAAVYGESADVIRQLILSFDTVRARAEATRPPLFFQPCYVVAMRPNTAALRDTPSITRAPFAYLPVGVEIPVRGWFAAPRFSFEWFLLDAPEYGARVWLRRGSAAERGDCDSVEMVSPLEG